MKRIIQLAISCLFALASLTAMATTDTDTSTTSSNDSTTMTDLSSKWICTTNASSSSVEADKQADEKMAKNPASATEAFAFASSHCRDCTKITCEVQNNSY